MSRIQKEANGKKPKKEDNTPQPKSKRLKLVESPITSKPKTIPAIISAIIRYSEFLKGKTNYYSM